MSYLEELLPEFRKGAKIRITDWDSNRYIYFCNGIVFSADNNIVIFPCEYINSNKWELYQEPEPDWGYIIKNKCLCWFWDEHDEEMKKAGILAYYDNNHFKRYIGDTCAVHWFEHCRPVRKDEVTFYEDRKDDHI